MQTTTTTRENNMAETTTSENNMSDFFIYNDGGREEAGYKGRAGDCVCRAVTIASGRPYREVYERLAEGNGSQRRAKGAAKKRARSARNGVSVKRKWFKDYMRELGFSWTPTMAIGSGCTVHVRPDELPSGRLVLALSNHYAAFIDGELHDTYDSSRDGSRCVYGYWSLSEEQEAPAEEGGLVEENLRLTRLVETLTEERDSAVKALTRLRLAVREISKLEEEV